jgi:hypothetical protein
MVNEVVQLEELGLVNPFDEGSYQTVKLLVTSQALTS